jgi:phosphomannomutase
VVRQVIAFDLDGTLAPSKSPLPDRISDLLDKLLDKYQVCVMSGGKFEQFEIQLLDNLKVDDKKLAKLHLMPTCGTRYYRFKNGKWHQEYAEDLKPDEKKKIIEAIEKAVDHFNYQEKKIYGENIEDRGSQISWSAYGQLVVQELGEEGIALKEAWDPDSKKKLNLVNYISPLIPEFEVRAGGGTTVDITKKGVDKAYGMQKLLNMLSISKKDVFFIGDRLIEGGNDYPVKAMGVDCMQISHWQETAIAIEAIIQTT